MKIRTERHHHRRLRRYRGWLGTEGLGNGLEWLEPRPLLAVLTVNTATD
jgi:hypothetical protein